MPYRILGEPFKTLGGVMRGGVLGSGSGGLSAVQFLFRDDFITDEGAPMVSPRTAEPGPGTWTLVDGGNDVSIVGEELIIADENANNDQRCLDDKSREIVAGNSMYAIYTQLGA